MFSDAILPMSNDEVSFQWQVSIGRVGGPCIFSSHEIIRRVKLRMATLEIANCMIIKALRNPSLAI